MHIEKGYNCDMYTGSCKIPVVSLHLFVPYQPPCLSYLLVVSAVTRSPHRTSPSLLPAGADAKPNHTITHLLHYDKGAGFRLNREQGHYPVRTEQMGVITCKLTIDFTQDKELCKI